MATTLVCMLATFSCGGRREATGPVDRYFLTGRVIRLDPQPKVATIKHEAIKDANGKVWMEAMTMEFPVKEGSQFAKLKTGSQIRATVFQRRSDLDFWIGEVKELSQSPSIDTKHPPVN